MTAISAGTYHNLALKKDGRAIAWGCGEDYGQCNVPASARGSITAVAADDILSLALKPSP